VDNETYDDISVTSKTNTGYQNFEIFMVLLILNYKMCRKRVRMVYRLIDLLTNFVAVTTKAQRYI
jgi:hypothetical protein